MRGVRWIGMATVGGFLALGGAGCVSLDDHNRLKAANRMAVAEKEKVDQDLLDERTVNDSLRTRVRTLESELTTKDELIANYRRENELLQGIGKASQEAMTKMAGSGMAPITIAGPKLPAPLDSALSRFASEHPSEVEYDAARGSVKWKADLLFPLGSDEVKQSSMETLRSFVEILKSPAAADFETVVVGHTDTKPISRPETKAKHPTNWHLSSHRAIAVGNSLMKFGYPPNRVGVMGCSEYRPVAENATEAGQSQNRRVEIYLVQAGSIVYSDAASAVRAVETRAVTEPRSSAP